MMTAPAPAPSSIRARVIASAAWLVAGAGALGVLWLGVYDVFGITEASNGSFCIATDALLLVIGIVANLAVATSGFLVLDRTFLPILTALPGFSVAALSIAFPCSFLPQIALPFACLLALAAAIVVVVRVLFVGGGSRPTRE